MLRIWILTIGLSTLFCLLVYITVQQNYRQTANDPQLQMAEDLRDSLNSRDKINSPQPQSQLVRVSLDLNKTLSPFTIGFDDSGKPDNFVGTNVTLDGTIPTPPTGVFEVVRSRGSEWFTWEPKHGLRFATILLRTNNGFVLAARNLKEVENREHQLLILIALAWFGSVIFSSLVLLIPKNLKFR